MIESKHRQSSFDVFKGIACIAVVLIHYNFEGDYKFLGDAVKAMCRWAVPFFFCVSGFFLLKGGMLTSETALKKLKNIIKIIFWAGVFYALFVYVWNIFVLDISVAKFLELRVTPVRIVRFFVLNQPFYCLPLWFLLALLYCYLFSLFVFADRGRLNRLYIGISAMALLVGMCLSQEFYKIIGFYPNIPIPASKDRMNINCLFIFRALPFFLAGVYFKLAQDKISKWNAKNIVFVLGALLGCLISIVEHFMIGVTSQFYCGSYLTAACVMIFCIRNPMINCEWLRYCGRELSMYIYVVQVAVANTYCKIVDSVFQWKGDWYVLTKPVMILGLVISFSFLIRGLVAFFKRMYENNNKN